MESHTPNTHSKETKMELRDYFAGLVLNAEIRKFETVKPETAAHRAYKFADAMMNERRKEEAEKKDENILVPRSRKAVSKSKFKRLAYQGASADKIAEQFGISRATVYKIVRENPDLKRAWMGEQ